jgi:SAM-dependent methyltransferase
MCDENCLAFLRKHLPTELLRGASILEVGSRDVNGSIRPSIEAFHPSRYLGVDLQAGPLVDEICDVVDLVTRFGLAAFQVVISTEMLEHVFDWRAAVQNLKQVLAPEGVLALTTRSIGFPYHEFPGDYWRYEPQDLKLIFADFETLAIERLPARGVGLVARKPVSPASAIDLSRIELYSVRPEHIE